LSVCVAYGCGTSRGVRGPYKKIVRRRMHLRSAPRIELLSHPHEKIIGRLLTVSTGAPRLLALQERVEQGDAEAGEDVVALRRGRLVAEDVAELGDLLGEAVS